MPNLDFKLLQLKKNAKLRDPQEGDMLLKEIGALFQGPRGNFRPYYLGPYIINAVLPSGVVKLMDVDEAWSGVYSACKSGSME